jgi:hypothetical protein
MRPAKKPLRAPILPTDLEARSVTSIDAAELEQCRLDGCTLSNQAGEDVPPFRATLRLLERVQPWQNDPLAGGPVLRDKGCKP